MSHHVHAATQFVLERANPSIARGNSTVFGIKPNSISQPFCAFTVHAVSEYPQAETEKGTTEVEFYPFRNNPYNRGIQCPQVFRHLRVTFEEILKTQPRVSTPPPIRVSEPADFRCEYLVVEVVKQLSLLGSG